MSLAQALSFSNACVGQVRPNWTREEVRTLFQLPFLEPIHRAAGVHRREGRKADTGREGAGRQ